MFMVIDDKVKLMQLLKRFAPSKINPFVVGSRGEITSYRPPKPLTKKEREELLNFSTSDLWAVVHVNTRPPRCPMWGIDLDQGWYETQKWYQEIMEAKRLGKRVHFLVQEGCKIPDKAVACLKVGEIQVYGTGELRAKATTIRDIITRPNPENITGLKGYDDRFYT